MLVRLLTSSSIKFISMQISPLLLAQRKKALLYQKHMKSTCEL